MQPRPYQQDAIDALFDYFCTKSGNPIIAAPTGTGKSVIIGGIVKQAFTLYSQSRILVATHVKELVGQNHKKLLNMWPTAPAGVYSAGLGRKDTHQPITYAGIASISDVTHKFGQIHLLIVDECHLISPKELSLYQKLITNLKKQSPYLKVIGLTATPYRLGLGTLLDGGIFTDICFDLTSFENFNKLVADGYIAPLVTKQTLTELDVSNVRLVGGEFVAKELQEAVDKDYLTRAALGEVLQKGYDRDHWLVFAAGIEHTEHIAEILNEMGIPTCAIHSRLTNQERDYRIAGFLSGRYRCAVNNGILTTGFDFPALDMIVMLRPTSSVVLWVQMLGRGTRPYEGKANCLVLDFAGNTRRLGPINDPVLPRPKGTKVKGEVPVKICANCNTYCHASVRICPECGAEFPRHFNVATTASTAEVMKLAPDSPIVEVYNVSKVIYSLHEKPGKPNSLKVTYSCGLQRFSEWILFEHSSFGKHKAHQWWRAVSTLPIPETSAEALTFSTSLLAPKSIRVHINTKFPTVVSRDFN